MTEYLACFFAFILFPQDITQLLPMWIHRTAVQNIWPSCALWVGSFKGRGPKSPQFYWTSMPTFVMKESWRWATGKNGLLNLNLSGYCKGRGVDIEGSRHCWVSVDMGLQCCIETGTVPVHWHTRMVVHIFKKGKWTMYVNSQGFHVTQPAGNSLGQCTGT